MKRLFLLLLCLFLTLPLQAATWYVRPQSAVAVNGDGSAYGEAATPGGPGAWRSFASIVWGGTGVNPGDTLYVCDTWYYAKNAAPYTDFACATNRFTYAGIPGNPIKIRGDLAGHPGVIIAAREISTDQWTDLGDGRYYLRPWSFGAEPMWQGDPTGTPHMLAKADSAADVATTDGSFYKEPFKNITTVTLNGSDPVRITCTGHGFTTGWTVRLTTTGLTPTLNQNFIVTRVDDNTFTLDGTNSSSYTGTVTSLGAASAQQLWVNPIGAIDKMYTNTVTALDTSGCDGYLEFYGFKFFGGSGRGIVTLSGPDCPVPSGSTSHISLYDCELAFAQNGIYASGYPVTDVLIQDCKIHDVATGSYPNYSGTPTIAFSRWTFRRVEVYSGDDTGLAFYNTRDRQALGGQNLRELLVEYCYIHDWLGDAFYNYLSHEGWGDNNIIRYNRINNIGQTDTENLCYHRGIDQTGTVTESTNWAARTANLQIYGNVISNIAPSAVLESVTNDPDSFGVGAAFRIAIAGGTDAQRLKIYNNTVYNCCGTLFVGGRGPSDPGFSYDFRNNLSLSPQPGHHHVYTANINNSDLIVTMSNNAYYPDGAGLFAWRNMNRDDHAAFVTALTRDGIAAADADAACIIADPLVVDAARLQLRLQSGSPAIDKGVEVGLTIDRDGNPIPQGLVPDIGAYEYVLEAANDLTVSGTSQNSLTLAWTVPGEPGVTGQPATYDLRYATSPITEANWETAMQVSGEPAASPFGQSQSFTVTGLNAGTTYYLALKVLDEVGHASALSNAVSGTTATTGNHAPVLTPIGERSVVETATLTFSISAADADGDPLTYTATDLPTGASFTAATQTFTWTPTNLQSGRYRVMFQVSDTYVTISETITITVRAGVDQPPVLAAIGNKSVYENASLSFSLSATDPDGDTLTYSATGLPSGASLVDGAFNWIPSYGQAGSYQVTFTASDGELTDSEQITITVTHTSDRTPPAAQAVYPTAGAIQVPVNSVIALTIADNGLGVDATTVAIHVNGQLVQSGSSTPFESAFGTCRRAGINSSYRYYYFPTRPFDFDQQVTVQVDASDVVRNAMMPVSYQFVTEMRSFGRNQPVSSEGDTSGHSATVTDSQGNLWAAWHDGQVGARDIYVAKRDSQLHQWTTPLRLTNLASDQCYPAIAVGPDDALYVAWQDNQRGTWDIYVSVSQDGSTWGSPVRVTDSDDRQMNPVIAIDHIGRVYVAWERGNTGSRDIYLVSSDSSLAGRTITRVTSDPADQMEPAVAVDADNTVYLLWTDQRNGSADIYGASSASSWANVAIVTGSGNQSHPALAVEPGASMLHVLWTDDAAGNLDVMHAASNGLPGSPLSGTRIVDDATSADESSPVITAAKDHWNNTHVYACWQDNRSMGSAHDSDLYFVEIRSGTAGTNILVGDDGTNSNQSEPALGYDEYGQPVVLWTDSRGSTPQIYSAGSTYSEPDPLASALIVRSEGGRVGEDSVAAIVDGSGVSISIPSYAYDCDVTISISDVQNLPKFTIACIAGYEIGPSGMQFSYPATVTIPCTSASLDRASPYWYDPQTGTLSQQGMTEIANRLLANGSRAISFKTTHLTTFYVLESPVSSGDAGDGGGGGGGCALSPAPEGNVAGYLLPYAGLVLLMLGLKRRDRRQKRT